MSRLQTWLKCQNTETAKSLTPLKGVDFLHISTNGNLKRMVPRIGDRQMKHEDRTIPRICGSESITGCIYGHSAVYLMSKEGEEFDGKEWTDGNVPCFHIYRLNIEEVVRPSKKMVPDVVLTKELWVVPYAPEACNAKPEKVGLLLPVRIVEISSMGKNDTTNHFYLYCRVPMILDKKVIEPGYYSFSIKGQLSPYEGVHKPENLKTITVGEWKGQHDELKRAVKERK